jgi:hypothetical protein
MQHYADMQLAEATFDNHVKWLEFLEANWEAGMARLFYDKVGKDLKHYDGGDSRWRKHRGKCSKDSTHSTRRVDSFE